VSRRWVITLVQRYLAHGDAGVEGRSRRPRNSPNRTPVAVEDEIVAIRKELDRAGHEAGAATIAYHLEQRHGSPPAVSTIWRILAARGFVTPQPHKRPKASYVRFQAEQPNERWQLDITHWALVDGTAVEILNMIDDHSRRCMDSHAQRTFTGPDVERRFGKTAATHGNPASLLSDNAAVFTGAPRRHGRVALEVTLAARGIRFDHSRPHHPQTCGKVERFHQTLKKWFARQPPASSLRQLQRQLDAFRAYYNDRRPHRALDRRTPAQAYAARPKAVPTGTPIDTGHWRTRHDRIDPSGVFTCGTTADSTTSASAAATPAPASSSSSSSTISTSECSPPTANSSANYTSTRPGLPTPTENVNHVPRHLCTMSRDITLRAPGRIRTCDARLRSPYRASSVGDGKCLQVPNLLACMRW
jgi:transposase InsO family protein